MFRFLALNRLPADDWYDVVIFRYIDSVFHWFNDLELHYFSFSTIVFRNMRSAVWNERQKQNRRIKTISLDAIIPGTEDVTYGETITYKNLDYINYKEEMECRSPMM